MSQVESISKKRVHCSDEVFLKAVFSSSTYAEVASKTGQKVGTVMARYHKLKSKLAETGETLPVMQRSKPNRVPSEDVVDLVRRIKASQDMEG